jgi:hypothetical protein
MEVGGQGAEPWKKFLMKRRLWCDDAAGEKSGERLYRTRLTICMFTASVVSWIRLMKAWRFVV